MQVYASHAIALNKSRPKILAHVSLNANCFIFTSGCLLLFTFSYTFMAPQKFFITFFAVNSRDTVYALCQHVIYVSSVRENASFGRSDDVTILLFRPKFAKNKPKENMARRKA